ncbi:MAG: hypothetical protein ABEJ47_01290 [Halorhabdus sp.]
MWSELLGPLWRTLGNVGLVLLATAMFVGAFLAFGTVMHRMFYPGTGVFIPDWQANLAILFGVVGVVLTVVTIGVEEHRRDTQSLTAEEVDDGVDA